MKITKKDVERYLIENYTFFTRDAADDMNDRIKHFKGMLAQTEKRISEAKNELLFLLAQQEHLETVVDQYEAAYGRAFTDGCKSLDA